MFLILTESGWMDVSKWVQTQQLTQIKELFCNGRHFHLAQLSKIQQPIIMHPTIHYDRQFAAKAFSVMVRS